MELSVCAWRVCNAHHCGLLTRFNTIINNTFIPLWMWHNYRSKERKHTPVEAARGIAVNFLPHAVSVCSNNNETNRKKKNGSHETKLAHWECHTVFGGGEKGVGAYEKLNPNFRTNKNKSPTRQWKTRVPRPGFELNADGVVLLLLKLFHHVHIHLQTPLGMAHENISMRCT